MKKEIKDIRQLDNIEEVMKMYSDAIYLKYERNQIDTNNLFAQDEEWKKYISKLDISRRILEYHTEEEIIIRMLCKISGDNSENIRDILDNMILEQVENDVIKNIVIEKRVLWVM